MVISLQNIGKLMQHPIKTNSMDTKCIMHAQPMNRLFLQEHFAIN